jgi:hypothetical protein
MRLIKSFALALLLFISGSLLGGTLVQIRVAHANARVEADSGAEIAAVLNKGQTLLVVEDVPYWYGVTLSDGQTAYVAKSLCAVVLPEEGENTEEEAGQPLSELYSIPLAGAPVTIPAARPRRCRRILRFVRLGERPAACTKPPMSRRIACLGRVLLAR